MTQDTIVSLVQNGLLTIIFVAGPPLIMGLTVGVLASIFQTITSIQEPTLAFIPKILMVLVAIIFFGPFMLSTAQDYMTQLFQSIPDLIIPR